MSEIHVLQDLYVKMLALLLFETSLDVLFLLFYLVDCFETCKPVANGKCPVILSGFDYLSDIDYVFLVDSVVKAYHFLNGAPS